MKGIQEQDFYIERKTSFVVEGVSNLSNDLVIELPSYFNTLSRTKPT